MTFLAVSLLFIGIAGLVVTRHRAGISLERGTTDAVRKHAPRGRSSEADVVRDLESIAGKVLAGAPLSRRDQKRAAELVRLLERR